MSKRVPSPRRRCLALATAAVTERAAAHGEPAPFFAAVARRWSLTLGVPITARQVALCLLDVKIERAVAAPSPHSVIDIAGYAACLFEIDDDDSTA